MRWSSIGAVWLVAGGLLVVAGWRLWLTLGDPAVMVDGLPADHWLFTGDFLYPALFWQDRADGLPVRGTAFSGASFVCPELLSYAVVRAVAPRPAAAVILWHLLSMGLAVAAFAVGLRSVAPPARRPFVAPLVVLLAAAWAGWVAVHGRGDAAVFELLLPMYHVGVMANGMATLALVAGWLRRGGAWRLAGVGLLTAVSVLSDRLTGPWVVGPLLLALTVTRLLVSPVGGHRLPVRWRAVMWVGFVLAAGTLAGLRALRWLNPEDAFGNYFSGPKWTTLTNRGGTVLSRLAGELAAGNPIVVLAAGAAVVSLAVLVAAVIRRRDGADRSGLVFLAAFGLGGGAAAIAAVALSNVEGDRLGTVMWEHISRYFLGPTAIGVFGWAVWLADRRGAWAVAGLAAVVVGWACAVPRSPTLDLFAFRPPFLEKLDVACQERGLTRGLAGFWLARPATVLSHAGLRVEQVSEDPAAPTGLIGYPWLSHPGRYWRTPTGEAPRFQFVVAHDAGDDPLNYPTTAVVVARLGEPGERVPLGGCTLLVYGRPADVALRDFSAHDPVVAVERWRAGADSLTLPGWFLRPRGPASELVACGPYIRLEPGRYRTIVRVSSVGARATGWTDIVLDEATGGPTERLLAQEVPAGFAGDLGGEFEVRRRRPWRLVFRAAGTGLTLHSARLERVP